MTDDDDGCTTEACLSYKLTKGELKAHQQALYHYFYFTMATAIFVKLSYENVTNNKHFGWWLWPQKFKWRPKGKKIKCQNLATLTVS